MCENVCAMPLSRDKSIKKIKQLRKKRRLAAAKKRDYASQGEERDALAIGDAINNGRDGDRWMM